MGIAIKILPTPINRGIEITIPKASNTAPTAILPHISFLNSFPISLYPPNVDYTTTIGGVKQQALQYPLLSRCDYLSLLPSLGFLDRDWLAIYEV